MALARIITRSHDCSRELALDLLARGYAVEIVSPEAIPDNIADLELRVDTGPGDQLIANVSTHNAEHSVSLEFLHYLKSPMGDFIRRSPDLDAFRPSGKPVGSPGGQNVEAIELPEQVVQAVSETVPAPGEVGREPEMNSVAVAELPETQTRAAENFREVVSQIPLPAPPTEPSAYPGVDDSTLHALIPEPPVAQLAGVAKPQNHSAGLPWRAVLTLAAVVLLALALGLGLRRPGKASTQNSNEASNPVADKGPADKPSIALNADTVSNAAILEKDSKSATPIAVPSATTAPANSDRLARQPAVAETRPLTAPTSDVSQNKVARKYDNDVVARDTVTYLDDRYKPAPKTKSNKQSASRHPTSHKRHSDIIAANKVIYLDKPAPKAAK